MDTNKALHFSNDIHTTNMILMLERTLEETRSSTYMLEYDFLLLSLAGLDY